MEMEKEYIRISCSNCGKNYRVENPEETKSYRCKECNERIVVKPQIKEKYYSKKINTLIDTFITSSVFLIIFLLYASSELPHYSYYILLRVVVFSNGIFGSYISYKIDKQEWIFIFGTISLLFNPLIPIHLTKNLWSYVDLITAGIFVISMFFIKIKKPEKYT